ncbi:MAG: glycoside hydrolase family 5 protein, partial [Rectinema sp.]|nr:glycoside hydrolase family 5 protein [Rectinema sp.]
MIAGTAGSFFIDEHGRTLILRGVNLGGSSKIPLVPDGRTHLPESLDHASPISFKGRPFPLEEADEHFSRLARWGQRFIRLLVTWEAIEHEGPGQYDEAYLDYVEAIVDRAARHGISLFIDPHQDVWSRWTGGDGAPAWTLEAVGFDPDTLHASGAAMRHQDMGAAYPQMQWFSNHLRLGCATMFTLFFAGDDYAPGIEAEGVPIQRFLQHHYIEALVQLARRLSGYTNVIGFGSMNEPGEGFVGIADIRAPRSDLLLPGLAPSPWEAMQAGEGLETEAGRIDIRGLRLAHVGRERLGTPGVRAWKEGQVCV